jgi:hypothetical protein
MKIFACLVCVALFASPALAQEDLQPRVLSECPVPGASCPAPAPFEPHHALTLSIMGAFGFAHANIGPFAVGYEWIIDEHWGVMIEGHFMHFHGQPVHINVTGGAIGVRYHIMGLRNSPFVGVMGGYHYGFGRIDDVAGQSLSVNAEQPFVTAHVGYRWVFPFGLNVTARIGAGYGEYTVYGSDHSAAAHDAIHHAREALGFTPVAIDSELALGYSF